MKSFGIVASPPPAFLIFLLSEIESAAPCAPLRLELVVNLVLELGAAQENEGERYLPESGSNRAARVFLCKYLGLDHERPRNFSF